MTLGMLSTDKHKSSTTAFRILFTMERLLSPCTRLHDTLEREGGLEDFRSHNPEDFQELNLDVSTEVLLSAERAFTHADLYAMLGNEDTIAWLTPHAFVARKGGSVVDYCYHLYNEEGTGLSHYGFSADDKYIVVMARSPEHLLEIVDIVLRLLAVSVVHSLLITDWSAPDLFISAPTLAHLLEQCQSLKTLTLKNLEMDEDLCRVLGSYSRPDLEIVLDCCDTTSAGASALAESLGRNQGPTKLVWCNIDNFVLADGLRGNSRLKSLRPRFSGSQEARNREILAIAGALRENKGLVDFKYYFGMSVETWDVVCDSLETHPTLEVLSLHTDALMAPAVLKSRIQALVDMLKVNMSIHTMPLDACYTAHELFQGSVIPYLETNRLRPRLLAIQRTCPIPYRAKVLGRALLAARTNANSFWMLLLGNAEVAFPSTTATTTPAANLPAPTPATAAATTSTTNVAAVVASVVSALTTSATGSLLTTAAATASSAVASSTATASDAVAFSVATASAGQKRKARP
jgi:hypothetical protein